ncbi:MAG: hypothetical protein Q7T29_17800 [Gallionella sp.]|nr:hypothetical protein [Gallionella sp.]
MPGQSWAEQGQAQRQPHEYVRNGTAKLLTLFCPSSGELRAKGVTAAPNAVLRIPRDGGHGSMLMAGNVPPSSRAPFHGDGGQHSILKADTPAVS